MKIGIIGSGNVGGVLGTRWAQAGHSVIFSSRNPSSDEIKKLLAEAGPHASAALIQDAVAASDILLLATPWPATRSVIESAGPFEGKIVIDATNPLLPDLSGLEVGTTGSGGELVAGWASGAKIVKAFNSVGNSIMADPVLSGQSAVLFYCGDDEAAKKTVRPLIADLGFDAQDAGPLTQARLLEPLAHLWISLAFTRGFGREFAFRIIRRA